MPAILPSRRMIFNVASSMKLMETHIMLPCGVRTSSARWAMANAGVVPDAKQVRLVLAERIEKCVRRIAVSVVQD